jgi:hypothetical protein
MARRRVDDGGETMIAVDLVMAEGSLTRSDRMIPEDVDDDTSEDTE